MGELKGNGTNGASTGVLCQHEVTNNYQALNKGHTSWLIQGYVSLPHRLLEVKHLYKKVENQIKMAKMVLINEINKRTNILLEQLEVSKASFFYTLGN